MIQCGSDLDSCSTIKYKVELAGTDFDETLRKCSIAESPACNQTYVCELINKSVAEAGGKLLECDVTCCQTDRCNGPDEGCCLCYTDKIIHWGYYNEIK